MRLVLLEALNSFLFDIKYSPDLFLDYFNHFLLRKLVITHMHSITYTANSPDLPAYISEGLGLEAGLIENKVEKSKALLALLISTFTKEPFIASDDFRNTGD